MALSKRIRHEIMRRDNHACRYCGQVAPDVKLTIDHVVPVTLGGSDDPTNLVTACVDCNAGKTSVAPDQKVVEDVQADALRWAAAMKRAAEMLADEVSPADAYADAYEAAWDSWTFGFRQETAARPKGWRNSLHSVYKAHLPEQAMLAAVKVAMQADHVYVDNRFRYFMGVCWRKVDEMRSVAEALLATEDQN